MKNLMKLGIAGLIIVQMLVVLTGCGEENKNTNENGNVNEVKVESNQIENKTTENTTNKQEEKITKTDKEIVTELFEKELEKSNPKLKEYKVTKVKILTGEDRKEVEGFFKQDVSAEGIKIKDKDILAEVTYSVKPEDINNSEWIAGNGEMEGDWMKNKFACVVVVEKNGTYEIVSNGTGW